LKNRAKHLELKEQLREIIPLNSGGSFQLLWEMLYHIRLLKYVHQSHLRQINPRYSKICATEKLKHLIRLELLESPQKDVYIGTAKIDEHLIEENYNTRNLPKISTGLGDINQLNNTDVFIQALKLPLFKTLLYPYFDYLLPDALLVLMDKDKYKLEFLEIEAGKSNWSDYIEKKRLNYLQLASDNQVYSYWKSRCKDLNIEPPDIKDLKFSVTFVGNIKKDFGAGFNFKEKLDV
jgi:hypothetical protein